jgi:hypothetical protein
LYHIPLALATSFSLYSICAPFAAYPNIEKKNAAIPRSFAETFSGFPDKMIPATAAGDLDFSSASGHPQNPFAMGTGKISVLPAFPPHGAAQLPPGIYPGSQPAEYLFLLLTAVQVSGKSSIQYHHQHRRIQKNKICGERSPREKRQTKCHAQKSDIQAVHAIPSLHESSEMLHHRSSFPSNGNGTGWVPSCGTPAPVQMPCNMKS